MSETYLVKNGRSVGAILRDTRSDNPVLKRAEDLIQKAVREAGGQDLPVFNYVDLRDSGRTSAVAIGTAGYMTQIFGLGKELSGIGDEGFYIFPTSAANALMIVVTGRTERAVYHGVTHMSDFLLRQDRQDLFIPEIRLKRAPLLKVRARLYGLAGGAYNLACWGRAPEYTADDWKRVLDAMAADSMNCVYFWLAGLFRSRRLPQTFTCRETKLTAQGVQDLIAHAHALGIEFYLGSGLFAWFGVDELAKTHPEAAAKGAGGLCPAHPTARQMMMDYLTEMYDAFPDADGLFLEIRDEYGECGCDECRKPLDAFGSRQYGAAEIGFLRELSQTVWRKHPRARFVSCIGYKEHKDDVRFYQALKEMDDPRFAWLVVRDNWNFPAEDGRPRPLAWFSPTMIHWRQHYRASLSELCDWVGRAKKEKLLGCCPAFEPGFNSASPRRAASFDSDQIPFPLDELPYAVTRLAFRELCWSPDMGVDDLGECLRKKFLGDDSPPGLLEALLYLFDLIREQTTDRALNPERYWRRGALREFLASVSKAVPEDPEAARLAKARLQAYIAMASEAIPHVEGIEGFLGRVAPTRGDTGHLPARARRTLPLLHKALRDAQMEFCLSAELLDQARLAAMRLAQRRA